MREGIEVEQLHRYSRREFFGRLEQSDEQSRSCVPQTSALGILKTLTGEEGAESGMRFTEYGNYSWEGSLQVLRARAGPRRECSGDGRGTQAAADGVHEGIQR